LRAIPPMMAPGAHPSAGRAVRKLRRVGAETRTPDGACGGPVCPPDAVAVNWPRRSAAGADSGEGYLVAEIDVLDGVQQLHALPHRSLEGLPSGDEAGAARALVDDRGAHGL